MAITVDNLEIAIQAKSTDAVKAVNDLKNALSGLNKALGTINKKDGSTSIDRLANNLTKMNNALGNLSDKNISKVRKLASAMAVLSDSMRHTKGIAKINSELERASEKRNVQTASAVGSAEGNTPSGIKKVSDAWLNMRKTLKLVDEDGKKVHTTFSKIMNTFGRIALYRAIRSAIKAITDAFKEGLTNAYKYSQQSETFKRLAETMDNLKTATSQMVNQLGALFGELKQTFAPLIEYLVEKIRGVAEWLTEIMAAINGADTYLYAEKVAVSWGKADENLKKYKGQLLGLDELNNLSSNDKSSGEMGTDYSTLYSEKAVSDKLKFLGNFKINIKDALFNWDNLSAEDIAIKCFDALGAMLGATIGFACGGWAGGVAGFTAGAIVTSMISGALFDRDGKLEKDEILATLLPALGLLTAKHLLFKKNTSASSALLTITAGALAIFTISQMEFEKGKNGKPTPKAWSKMVAAACMGIAGGVIGFLAEGKGNKARGVLVGISIGATLGYYLSEFAFEKAKNTSFEENKIGEMIAGISMGIAGGALTVLFTGNPGTMLFGITAGATMGYKLSEMYFEKNGDLSDEDKIALIESVGSIATTLMGAAIGFKATKSLTGAVMGGSIALALSLGLADMLFTKEGKYTGATADSLIGALANDILPWAIGFGVGFYFSKGNLQVAALTATAMVALKLILGDAYWQLADGMGVGVLADKLNPVNWLFGGKLGSQKVNVDAGIGGQAVVSTTVNPSKSFSELYELSHQLYSDQIAVDQIFSDDYIKKNYLKGWQSADIDAFFELYEGSVGTKNQVLKRLLPNNSNYSNTHKNIIGNETVINDLKDRNIGRNAMGGVPTQGTLFYAGEAGPEFIGNIGNTSAVANTDQMTDAIYRASYMGMAKALAENSSNGMNGFEAATTDDLWLVLRKKSNQRNKMTGNFAM